MTTTLEQSPVDDYFVYPDSDTGIDFGVHDTYGIQFTQEELRGRIEGIRSQVEQHSGQTCENLDDNGRGLVKDAMHLALGIGDQVIRENDPNNEAGGLLQFTRQFIRPEDLTLRADMGGLIASFETGNEQINVNEKVLDPEYIGQFFSDETNDNFRHPADARTIVLVWTVAHEAGHAQLKQISESIHSEVHPDAEPWKASAEYINRHPEQAFTGNLESDVLIQEERFAEGYGSAVARRVIAALGYQGEQAAAIISDVRTLMHHHTGGHEGENQLDHLKSKPSMVPLRYKVGDTSSEDQLSAAVMGYDLPLSESQLAGELAELADAVKNRQYGQDMAHPLDWYRRVKGVRRDEEVREHIKSMQKHRADRLGIVTRREKITRQAKETGIKALLAARIIVESK